MARSRPPRAPRQIGVAMIGQQFMGRAHGNAWGQVAKFFDLPAVPRLVTIAARDAGSLGPFARRWGWERYTTDWRLIAPDPEIDLVDIATPNHVHAEPSIAMLEAGKHVACEKPLAGTLADARAMREAARRAKGKTFVWFNYRRCPAVGTAWRLIREGALGRIYHVRAHYLQSWGGKETPLLWRFRKRLAGSGAHGDLNAHLVDLARFLTGQEVVSVDGAVSKTVITRRTIPGTRRKGRSDVDDATLFLATMAGGAVASFEASRVATGHQNDNTIELNGERGSLRFSFEEMNLLWYFDATLPKRTQGWRRIMCTTPGEHPYAEHWWPEAHLLGYEHGFVNMAADILKVLGRRRPELPIPDFADAYETQRVLEAAMLSARERCAVPLREVR
ncbi:MAG: Gfo/Idh/MocA family oxidoreductase [Gemmatimonadales bacterium]|nr:Gfo/Idh/MocA family oxidoreductase [Gemmatimonadales bacterium]